MLFAGSMLNAQLPAVAEGNEQSSVSIIEKIVNHTQISAEMRAYYLLGLASAYLYGGDKASLEIQYTNALYQPGAGWTLGTSEKLERNLSSWTDRVALEEKTSGNPKKSTKDAAFADEAITAAVNQLDAASDQFAKVSMYFIASKLFQKSGNLEGAGKCDKFLQDTFQTCERGAASDEKQIKAVASVLNSMAYALIPVSIPDGKGVPIKQVSSFTDETFKDSEKLKLRAIAILDRLPATADARRKAHRDLVLWYLHFGKDTLADAQKQVLFELVGAKNDSILYPQDGACGHLVWWETKPVMDSMDCGMG